MKKKERLIIALHVSGKLIKDILLKKPRHVVVEEANLLKWHWSKLFDK